MTKRKGLATWQEITTGCVVFDPGSASEYHTEVGVRKGPFGTIRNVLMRHLLYFLSGRLRTAERRRIFPGEHGLL